MKKILIDKEIGETWYSSGISAANIREELDSFNEGDNSLEFVIDSPGGSVWEGISIFNIIRNFARENPNVRITSYIQGIAASMASVIALAAKSVNPENKVICEDNSVFMIHNAWTYASGNHLDLEKEAEQLKSIDSLLRDIYTKVSGRSEKAISKEMDEETWLYGEDIVLEGFADEVIDSGKKHDEKEDVLSAKANFLSAMDSLKMSKERESYKECAMILKKEYKKPVIENIAERSAMDMEESHMTVEELKSSNPDVYNAIYNAGKEDEKTRVEGHLKMGEIAGCLDVAAGFIRDGSAVADTKVQTTYFEKRVANAENTKRVQDTVKNVDVPVDEKSAENDKMALFMKGFDSAVGIKD